MRQRFHDHFPELGSVGNFETCRANLDLYLMFRWAVQHLKHAGSIYNFEFRERALQDQRFL